MHPATIRFARTVEGRPRQYAHAVEQLGLRQPDIDPERWSQFRVWLPEETRHRHRRCEAAHHDCSLLEGLCSLDPQPLFIKRLCTVQSPPRLLLLQVYASDDDSDEAFYGLFALLVLPVLVCIAVAIVKRSHLGSSSLPEPTEVAADYPVADYPEPPEEHLPDPPSPLVAHQYTDPKEVHHPITDLAQIHNPSTGFVGAHLPTSGFSLYQPRSTGLAQLHPPTTALARMQPATTPNYYLTEGTVAYY